AFEGYRRTCGRHHCERGATEWRGSGEHRRPRPTLRRKRIPLVLERDASAEERGNSSEAPADPPAAARERTQNDGEWRKVLARDNPRIGTDSLINRCAERHRSRGAFGRPR